MVTPNDESIAGELVYLERFVDRRPTWAPIVLNRLGELGEEGRADLPRLLAERTVKAKHLAARRRAQMASRAAAVAVLVAGSPVLVGGSAAASNLPAIGTSHQQGDMLEVRVTDSQTGQPLAGVTLMTADEQLVGVTDAQGAVSVPAHFAQEPVISLERDGYPLVLVEGAKLTGRSMIAMRHFSAGIEQAQTTGPVAALTALALGHHANTQLSSKPIGYAGEPTRAKPQTRPAGSQVAAAPKPQAPAVTAPKAQAPVHVAPPIQPLPIAKAPTAPAPEAPKAAPQGPVAPFSTASAQDAPAPFAKAPMDSSATPFKAPSTTGQAAAEAQAQLEALANGAADDHPSVLAAAPKAPGLPRPADLPEDQTAPAATQHLPSPSSIASAAGLTQPKAPAAASKPVVQVKLPARSPRASQRIRAAELASAPPAAATVAIAPENLPMPALASLPAVNQEPAPGWAMVSLPSRPKQPVVAQAPKPMAMAKVTLPARPRAPQLAAAPHLGSTLAKPLAATYHVKAGDTLSEIALRELGSSTLWHVVYDANRDQLTDPRWLEVGLTLKIPRGNDAGGQVYVVKQGDSLSKIARVMLGDMKKWRDLYAANKQQIKDPWFIFPGQRLVLPGTQNLASHQVDQRWATLKATVYPPA